MARGISNALARLIRDRAYLGGELAKADNCLAEASAALKAVRVSRCKIAKKVAILDAKIAAANLDPSQIRPITLTPRVRVVRHGSFTSEIVAVVLNARGPITTGEIIGHLIATHGLPYSNPAERDKTRRCIVERLRVLARKGAIQRLHNTNDNQEGLWSWIGI